MDLLEPIKAELFKNIESFINEIEICFDINISKIQLYIKNLKTNKDDFTMFVDKTYLHLHPFVSAFFREGFPSLQMKWLMKYRKWITIHVESEYTLNEYRFFDEHEDEIRLNQSLFTF